MISLVLLSWLYCPQFGTISYRLHASLVIVTSDNNSQPTVIHHEGIRPWSNSTRLARCRGQMVPLETFPMEPLSLISRHLRPSHHSPILIHLAHVARLDVARENLWRALTGPLAA